MESMFLEVPKAIDSISLSDNSTLKDRWISFLARGDQVNSSSEISGENEAIEKAFGILENQ